MWWRRSNKIADVVTIFHLPTHEGGTPIRASLYSLVLNLCIHRLEWLLISSLRPCEMSILLCAGNRGLIAVQKSSHRDLVLWRQSRLWIASILFRDCTDLAKSSQYNLDHRSSLWIAISIDQPNDPPCGLRVNR